LNGPLRYRIALRAYPAAYRRARGAKLLATLADGDDDRGGRSAKEAAALVYRGLAMRTGVATSGGGLLVAASVVLLVALTGGFTWAEREFLFRGDTAAYGTDRPGLWLSTALAVVALAALTIGPSGAWDSPRRRRAAILLACPLALAVFTGPGRVVHIGLSGTGSVGEFLGSLPAAVYANWNLTLPASVAAMLGMALVLRILDRLRPSARPRALAAALVLLSATAVVQAWHRPDLPAEYGRSAFADLGAGAFVAALGLLLAAVAAWRMRPRPPRRVVR
jgi:hypothetical protein